MNPDLNKARLYFRLEKAVVTLESIAIGAFIGICATGLMGSIKLGAVFGILSFTFVTHYKRYKILKERR